MCKDVLGIKNTN